MKNFTHRELDDCLGPAGGHIEITCGCHSVIPCVGSSHITIYECNMPCSRQSGRRRDDQLSRLTV